MLLTKEQRYLLEVLDKLGSLRRDQLTALICAKFCTGQPERAQRLTDAMLRQLQFGNAALCIDGENISLPNIKLEPLRCEAVSVMLELSQSAPLDFSARQRPPALLRFSTAGKRITLFAVLTADAWNNPLRPPPKLSPMERVILLPTGGDVPQAIPVPNKCFLAVLQEDGTHRFFEAATNQKED